MLLLKYGVACVCVFVAFVLYSCGPTVYYDLGETFGANDCLTAVMNHLPDRHGYSECNYLICSAEGKKEELAWADAIDATADRQTDACFRTALHGWATYYRREASMNYNDVEHYRHAQELSKQVKP